MLKFYGRVLFESARKLIYEVVLATCAKDNYGKFSEKFDKVLHSENLYKMEVKIGHKISIV